MKDELFTACEKVDDIEIQDEVMDDQFNTDFIE